MVCRELTKMMQGKRVVLELAMAPPGLQRNRKTRYAMSISEYGCLSRMTKCSTLGERVWHAEDSGGAPLGKELPGEHQEGRVVVEENVVCLVYHHVPQLRGRGRCTWTGACTRGRLDGCEERGDNPGRAADNVRCPVCPVADDSPEIRGPRGAPLRERAQEPLH